MLHFISWKTIIGYLFIAVALYYAAILFLYFKKEIAQLANARKRKEFFSLDKSPVISSDSPELLSLLHLLQDELKRLFAEANSKRFSKGEVFMALQPLLYHYRQLRGTPLFAEVQKNIIQGCKTGSITLSDAEWNMLWNG